jgi:hypothetical protein
VRWKGSTGQISNKQENNETCSIETCSVAVIQIVEPCVFVLIFFFGFNVFLFVFCCEDQRVTAEPEGCAHLLNLTDSSLPFKSSVMDNGGVNILERDQVMLLYWTVEKKAANRLHSDDVPGVLWRPEPVCGQIRNMQLIGFQASAYLYSAS